MKTIIYPVKDIARREAALHAAAGVEPDMDEPYYVGFKVDGQDVGLDPNGHGKGMTGPRGYWHVDDINATSPRWSPPAPRCSRTVADVGGGSSSPRSRTPTATLIGLLQPPAGGWS